MKNKIGKLIRKARKEKGLTLQQVADLCAVSNSMVSNWERGMNIPAGDVLIRLAKKLGFIDALLEDDPSDEEIVQQEMNDLKDLANSVNSKLDALCDEFMPSAKHNNTLGKIRDIEKKILKLEKQLQDISSLKEKINKMEQHISISNNRDIVMNAGSEKKM
ncbi:helix-turn-helix domain-containing protein [Candidatus Uabimicrobium sp. HlEnr_7]|uniref:helix-turn-helix domain-containing protein n=1 Tax=Candidatus Uabimicrobium helgolandensis TaxID=3095367 RepID=UPI003558CCC3